MGAERREYERKSMRGPARLTINGKPSMMVRILDISLGGLSVVCNVNLPSKQIVKMEFNILIRKSGAYTALVTNASVAYAAFSNEESGFKLGLQFTALTDAYKVLILQYVGTKKAAPAIPENAPKDVPQDNQEERFE